MIPGKKGAVRDKILKELPPGRWTPVALADLHPTTEGGSDLEFNHEFQMSLTCKRAASTLQAPEKANTVPKWSNMSRTPYQWVASGDVNAFFGLMLDNIAGLLLTIGLLATVFDFPTNFAIGHMVPGTAIGVLVGDGILFFVALSLARRTGRNDVTAMPLGLDTPSTFGMVLFVLGPAYLHASNNLQMPAEQAAIFTWHIGIWSIVLSGLFKGVCALGAGWVRTMIPRAGLLGSLAAVALVLISFLPLVESLHYPVIGMTALSLILITLTARIGLPLKIPGALAAMVVSGVIYYLMLGLGILGAEPEPLIVNPREALLPTDWLTVFRFEWLNWQSFNDAIVYLPIVIPFALGTVIGGIDCVESAAAAGDEYHTGQIIGIEALATLVAGLCGGVIQTTPYIGHPAYKAMGGRSAYVLATALFVGGAGLIGYFGYLYWLIPKPTLFPILVFIGLEITSQSFHATPRRHYPALALACVPALAAMVLIFVGELQGKYVGLGFQLQAQLKTLQEILPDQSSALAPLQESADTLQDYASGKITRLDEDGHVHSDPVSLKLQTLQILSSGFILTSLLWATALASIIDRRLLRAAMFLGICGLCSLFGIIHSPLPGSPMVLFWDMPDLPLAAAGQTPVYWAVAYAVMAVIMLAVWPFTQPPSISDNPESPQEE